MNPILVTAVLDLTLMTLTLMVCLPGLRGRSGRYPPRILRMLRVDVLWTVGLPAWAFTVVAVCRMIGLHADPTPVPLVLLPAMVLVLARAVRHLRGAGSRHPAPVWSDATEYGGIEDTVVMEPVDVEEGRRTA
ncbi:hypothetical protein [Bifidobacterium sp.]|uniref:hypothetical protein n=1 Tax=Bifidobacterium sp. TaxID=41200 RepID=UPI00402680FE